MVYLNKEEVPVKKIFYHLVNFIIFLNRKSINTLKVTVLFNRCVVNRVYLYSQSLCWVPVGCHHFPPGLLRIL